MINRILTPSAFPPCLRCGQSRLSRSPQHGKPVRLAVLFRLYPFHCDACQHRFFALVWGKRYVEWDDQVLVMPTQEPTFYAYWDGARDFYFLIACAVLLGLLIVWGFSQCSQRIDQETERIGGRQ